LPLGPGDVLDAVASVEAAGVGVREDFYWTLHAVLVKRREHSALFDQAFRLFWRRRAGLDAVAALLADIAGPASARPGARRVADALKSASDEAEERERTDAEASMTVSDEEVLRAKDFAQMTADEIARAKRAIAALRLPNDRVRTRRLVPSNAGRLDPRRTMRASLRGGGEVIDLAMRRPALRHPPLVALCDISGSMAEYTRMFLHFLHAAGESRGRVHVFLFATRLTNVTREVRARDPDEALQLCARRAQDWEGGTRLAGSLRDFNRLWSRRVLGSGATVLLFTDGLERRVTPALAFETDRLRRSARRLIWLNPLLRFEGFQARPEGIRAMLPHVDEMRPVHNLRSMEDLVRALSGAGAGEGRAGGGFAPPRWMGEAA